MSAPDRGDGAPTVPLAADDLVYYLHIPKTAGTTFNAVLETYFDPAQIWPVGELVGPRLASEIADTPPEVLRNYRLIRGHYDYSIHRLLPRPPVYVTMLRHPVDRTISLYRHILRVPTHRLHAEMTAGTGGVRDLLEHEAAPRRFNDRQVHQIAGTVHDRPAGLSDAALLDIAKQRLEREFRFFGLVERFEDSLAVLCATLGWPAVESYRTLNTGSAGQADGLVDGSDRTAIAEHNELDMELYEFAVHLFSARYDELVRRRRT